MNLRIDSIGLFVNDMEVMVKFYRDVLGFTTNWKGENNAELFLKDTKLIMFGRKDFEQRVNHKFRYPLGLNGTMEISFNVEKKSNVNEIFNKLINLGAKILLPPTDEPWGQRTCYLYDPEGNLLKISSFND